MPTVRSRSERLPEAVLLAAVGGYLDAYTYLAHGGVFANSQTGNVVLFGVDAARGRWGVAWPHLPPIGAFVLGVVTAELLARMPRRGWLVRPTRVILLVEIAAFLIVGLLPASAPDAVVTVVIAWAATLQVATFRTVGAVSYNTTFTTGNIRTLVSEAAAWFGERDAAARTRALSLACVIGTFAVGAVLGAFATRWLGTHAVLLTLPVLAVVLVMIVRDTLRLESAGAGPR